MNVLTLSSLPRLVVRPTMVLRFPKLKQNLDFPSGGTHTKSLLSQYKEKRINSRQAWFICVVMKLKLQ
jgi:hypothetical protein